MKSNMLKIILSSSLLVNVLFADESADKMEGKHSVRQVIDKFGAIEDKKVDIVDKFQSMFKDGKITGQIRSIYASYDQKNNIELDTYAVAIGGMLKYELASLHGFNAAVSFTTSEDIGFATGDANSHNNELSSSSGSYTELTESYINYAHEGLNIRLGRQTLDTPLADSDDIRMIQNTFKAYLLSYQLSDFEIIAINVQNWQGVDADLDNSWIDIGSDGTMIAAITYSDLFDFRAWYYDVPLVGEETKAVYLDAGYSIDINKDMNVHVNGQFLSEKEVDGSGISATIYGIHGEVIVNNLGFNIAYNHSKKLDGKKSFSGIGGGSMFTSMDTLIIDDIAEDREVNAIVGGLMYTYKDFSLLYAYGDFKGTENSLGVEEHIVEQDVGFEYIVNGEFEVAGVYAMQNDRENTFKTSHDWHRTQIIIKYDF